MKVRNGFLIIILMVLVGTLGVVSAEEEIPVNIGETFIDRITSNIMFFFHEQERFTIYGRELSCSTQPDRTHFLTKGERFYFNSVNTNDDFFANYFRGEPGSDQYIFEAYYDNDKNSAYITDGNLKGSLYISSYIVCDAGAFWNNKCYVQTYNCDVGFCEANLDCSSDEICDKSVSSISNVFPNFGICVQEEVTFHETKVYDCKDGSSTFLGEVNKGSINWCNDPDEYNYILPSGGTSGVCYEPANEPLECNTPQKTCWRIQDNQCASFGIYTTSCDGSGYYSSKSNCEADIDKGLNICPVLVTKTLCSLNSNCEWSFFTCKEKDIPANGGGEGDNGNGDDGAEWKASESFTIEEIKSSPAEALSKGICTESIQCGGDSTCKIVDGFVTNGDISEDRVDVLRQQFCQNEVEGLGLITFKAFTDDDFFKTCKSLTGKTKYFQNNYGFCIEGETKKDINLEWAEFAAWFDVTGDGQKNGTDGAIILSILVFFAFILLRK